MYKQIITHSYNGILFSNKKELTTDACNNMGESQKRVEGRSLTQKSTGGNLLSTLK